MCDWLLLSLTRVLLLQVCGSGNPGPSPLQNPSPCIDAMSPNRSDSAGAEFTLGVVGSKFIPGSVVHWNRVTNSSGVR